MSEDILFETERIYLRRLTAEDGGLLFELDSDPETMRFISKGVPTPRKRIDRVIMPRILSYYRAWPPQGFWIAHLRDNNDFIGWFHLRPDKITPAEMELGYRLKRAVWGRGLATEGARRLVQKGVGEWDYPKVSARTLQINLASRRVMEKAGLQFEHDFLWNEQSLPEWSEGERKGVKYSATR
jgi:RimJ/RimL family protein N-acetyltransferase